MRTIEDIKRETMYSVFYRNVHGEQRVVNWFGDYSRFVVSGARDAIALARWCFGPIDILAVIHWQTPQLASTPIAVRASVGADKRERNRK